MKQEKKTYKIYSGFFKVLGRYPLIAEFTEKEIENQKRKHGKLEFRYEVVK